MLNSSAPAAAALMSPVQNTYEVEAGRIMIAPEKYV